jgi:hypothetical protein
MLQGIFHLGGGTNTGRFDSIRVDTNGGKRSARSDGATVGKRKERDDSNDERVCVAVDPKIHGVHRVNGVCWGG